MDLFSIYQHKDELKETIMNRFKHHQDGFNRDLKCCIHQFTTMKYLTAMLLALFSYTNNSVTRKDNYTSLVKEEEGYYSYKLDGVGNLQLW